MRRVWKGLKEAQEQGQLLNQRQKLFELPVVPFDAINKLIKEFEPYKSLWITASDWLRSYDMWMDNPLVNVDGEAIERIVNEMYKTMVKSIRTFAEIVAVQNVAIEIRRQIDEFRPLIPLIQAVRSPGMRPRHWDHILEETGKAPPNRFLDLSFMKSETQRREFGDDSNVDVQRLYPPWHKRHRRRGH